MDTVKKFFEEGLKTPEAKALLETYPKAGSMADLAKVYSEVAGKLGCDIAAEDVEAYLKGLIPAAPAKKAALDMNELAQIVGGSNQCKDTFLNEENCWWNDACDVVHNYYEGYLCSWCSHYEDDDGEYTSIGVMD